MDNTEKQYSKARFAVLVNELYGVNFDEEEQRFELSPGQKKNIAEDLAFDRGQITKFFNSFYDDDSAYENIIKRLEIEKERRTLRDKMTALETSLKEQAIHFASEARSVSTLRKLCYVLGGVLFLVLLLGWFILPQSSPNGYRVNDKVTLNQIEKYHAELMVYRLFYEAAWINQKVQRKEILVSDSILNESTKTNIQNAMSEGRDALENLGFVNKDGKNIVSFMNELYPVKELFSDKESLFGPAFEAAKPHLMDTTINFSDLLKYVRDNSKRVSDKQWEALWIEGWGNKEDQTPLSDFLRKQ